MAERDEVLATERAVNEQYRIRLQKEMEADRTVLAQVTSLCRSTIWTTGTPMKGAQPGPVPSIIGRVAFDRDAREFSEGLYIGPRYQESGELVVISWAAPVAQLFFAGRRSTDPAADAVAGRRSFVTRLSDIIDFADDVEDGADPSRIFVRRAGRLEVPSAPRAVRRPAGRSTPATTPRSTASAADRSRRTTDTAQPSARNHTTVPPAPTPTVETAAKAPPPAPCPPREDLRPAAAPETVPLRAERAVLDALERPRTGHLGSLLATLQPDQYELVTWPADEPLIVAGAPGTGKTVVAMHRAGYLTHPDRPGGPMDRVAVIGPTDEYREHVSRVTRQVGGKDVVIHGLPSFLARLADVDQHRMKVTPDDRIGVSWELWSAIARAKLRIDQAHPGSGRSMAVLVRALVTDSPLHRASVGEDRDVSRWLLSISTLERAKSETRFLPFLAACGLLARSGQEDLVDHLVVDEAQDVQPLVWRILLGLLRPNGSMTLFGDMNQRRSDWTASSWEELARDLELTDDTGAAPVRTLSTGYRTTRQILKFANQLLPRGHRDVHALREGIRPTLIRTGRKTVVDETVSATVALTSRHADGLVAVIAQEPRTISDSLRRVGWRSSHPRGSWTCDGATVFVLRPDQARGLEFDGVVVVEPADFPENVGRDGVLYTSLTRATKELVVVHSRALPGDLRPPR